MIMAGPLDPFSNSAGPAYGTRAAKRRAYQQLEHQEGPVPPGNTARAELFCLDLCEPYTGEEERAWLLDLIQRNFPRLE